MHPIPQVSLTEVPTGTLWVDAREPAAYAASHIPGALSVSETNWEQSLPVFLEAWNPGTPVVVYCGGSSCGASRTVAKRLRRELRIGRVYILDGGWNVWRAQHP